MSDLSGTARHAPRRIARRLRFLAAPLLPVLFGACSEAASATDDEPVTLTVAAASSLAPAFEDLAARFEAKTGTRVLVTLGASGQLAQQVRQGAPVDLFASADRGFVEALAGEGRIVPGTDAVYARGRLVLWTRAGAPFRVERMEDLLQPGIRRIALANPEHAPYGRAARQALESAGIWSELRPKLVLGETVRQTFQYAETGNVDVALVAESLADRAAGRRALVPEALHEPLDHMLAVIRGTPHETEARRLSAFLRAPEGQAILLEHGLMPPRERVARPESGPDGG